MTLLYRKLRVGRTGIYSRQKTLSAPGGSPTRTDKEVGEKDWSVGHDHRYPEGGGQRPPYGTGDVRRVKDAVLGA